VALLFTCPKCAQKLTLTTSKPGDWIDCPKCEKTVQIPGGAPPKPAPAATPAPSGTAPSKPASSAPPKPAGAAMRPRPAPVPIDPDEDEPQSVWADKRVQVAALAGGIGVLLVGVLVVSLAVKKPKKEPEVVRDTPPPAAQPAPAPPTVVPRPSTPPAPPKGDPPVSRPSPVEVPPVEPKVDPSAPPKPRPNFTRLDQFGNPLDQNTALAQQGELTGQRLLFWSPHTGAGDMFFALKNPLWKAFEEKGFTVRREFGKFDRAWLKEIDQLWILSTADERTLASQRKTIPDIDAFRKKILAQINALTPDQKEQARKKLGTKFPKGSLEDIVELEIGDAAVTISPVFHLTDADYRAIVEFAKAGKGLCLLADNDPFTVEANELAGRLFSVRVSGNYQGEKIAYVRNGRLTPEQIKMFRGDYEVADHPILTGVNFVYEGITISNVSASSKLDVALKASDGKPVIVVSKDAGLRIIIDCGFTRYCHGPNDDVSFILLTAGTTRLAQNMAAFLAGKEAPK
jgi:hypothetical protein